jgi:hypothetical protein
MGTLYIEGLASHMAASRASAVREGGGEAAVGGTRGRGDGAAKLMEFGVPTPWVRAEGNTAGSAMRELPVDPARSRSLCMCGVSGRENREISWPPVLVMAGRAAQGRPRP